MARTIDEFIAELPEKNRRAIEARSEELIREIEGLRALRLLMDRSQEQLAASLGVKQPAISKMEHQADLYLSTLRRFVEASGGHLELRIELPGKGIFRLSGLGELGS